MYMKLNFDSAVPLYQQIYEGIRSKILGGALSYGTKLPSKRRLSDELRISQNTVDTAYQQLAAEGYLKAVPKSGFYVEDIILQSKPLSRQPDVFYAAGTEQPEPIKYDFAPDRVDTDCFPFATWVRLSKEIMHDENRKLLERAEPQGDLALRAVIADYLLEYRGIHTLPQQIVIGAGTEYLFQLLMQILGRKRTVAIENPGYEKTHHILRAEGIRTELIDVGNAGLCMDLLERSEADTVYLTPSHQFPMGVVMPVSQRMQLLRWASERENRVIIEDDYDHEFRYEGKPIPALKGMDEKGKVVYLGTFSRSIAPSVRISYMVLPPSLLEVYQRSFLFYSCPVSRFEQFTLSRFLQDGHYERHINRMRKLYRGRRDALIRELYGCCLGSEITIYGADAGLHLLVVLNHQAQAEQLQLRAACAGIRLHALSEYCFGELSEQTQRTFVFGYAHLNEEEIGAAVRLLSGFCEKI